MREPKCRTCGKEHRLGVCPEFQSSRGGGESRPTAGQTGETGTRLRASESSREPMRVNAGSAPSDGLLHNTRAAGVATGPRETKIGRPRIEDIEKTIEAVKPWLKQAGKNG